MPHWLKSLLVIKYDLKEDAVEIEKILMLTNQWVALPASCSVPICKSEQTSSLSSGKGSAIACIDLLWYASTHLQRSCLLPPPLPLIIFNPLHGLRLSSLTFKPPQSRLPLSSHDCLSFFLPDRSSFILCTPEIFDLLPVVCKVQRNLRPLLFPTVSRDSFISQASFTLSHS